MDTIGDFKVTAMKENPGFFVIFYHQFLEISELRFFKDLIKIYDSTL